jgi:hypothetical protein
MNDAAQTKRIAAIGMGMSQRMSARRLSTRDSEAALEEATGERLLRRSTVSRLSESLTEEYEAFCQPDLSTDDIPIDSTLAVGHTAPDFSRL